MKNRFFCVVMVLLSVLCLPLQAQNAPASGGQSHRGLATVEGIWQLCTFQKGETGETEIHLAPVLKVVSGDGTYNDIIIKTTAGGCVITGSGRYMKANDSLLVFQPSKLRHLDAGAPKADSVTFRLEGPQWMLLERKPATGEEPAAEIWMRLRQQPGSKAMMENGDTLQKGATFQKGERPKMGQGRGQQGKGRAKKQQQPVISEMGTMDDSGVDHSWMNED